jgi:ribosomal-protein-alanine N-acetyltransferase
MMQSQRLIFRKLTESDAEFIYSLVNDPDWLQYIGDRKVNSLEDAARFIVENINAHHHDDRLGLKACCIRGNFLSGNVKNNEENKDTPIGVCGLLERDYLDSIDVGYAFAKKYRGFGYAIEAASFFKAYAFNELNFDKLYATVSKENGKSISLLKQLDFKSTGGLIVNNEESGDILLYETYRNDNLSLFQFRRNETRQT